MSTRIGSLALSFVLVGGGISSAQTISVRTLALQSGEMPKTFLKGPKEHHPLRFSTVQPELAVKALSASPLPLYRSTLDEDGNPAFAVAAKVKIPAGAGEILLLGWAANKQARYLAIKDDFGSASFDDWILINTTKKQIAFQVGEKAKPIVMNPGASMKYRVRAEKGKGATVLAQQAVNGKALARRFLLANPDSPLAARVRTSCDVP